MNRRIDDTHDPLLRSWLSSAIHPESDFPIQNLPFGIFKRSAAGDTPHIGVAIGDRILDLAACQQVGLFTDKVATATEVCGDSSLNRLMALGRETWSALRWQVTQLLREGDTRIRAQADWETQLLPAMRDADLFLPVNVGDYTDFFSSIHHATNVGRLFRPDQPLQPNYKYVPVGYHGRTSSINVSGVPVRRPCGQIKTDDSSDPEFGPIRMLDYEAELGFFVGPGNPLGEPVGILDAEDQFFGICLLNDWSARDIQKWEYRPLGPFLAKSFATTLSPWVVTFEALAPYRTPFRRPPGDPDPLPYLDHGSGAERAGLDVKIEVYLSTPRMRESDTAPVRLSHGHARDLYWTPGQLLAHHTSNGCNLLPGDLLGSGTISGPEDENEGCLLERTRGGQEPIRLPGGETRRSLADGDEVILKGYCEAEGFLRIGLGECRGKILPAPEM